MSIKKEGVLKFENTAHHQNKKDTDIVFFTSDDNTSFLKFYLTQNKKPLYLGKDNADISIKLIFNGGSWLIDDVEIIDELNGICEFKIPNDFLKYNGKVKGQLFISVNSKDKVATQIDFNFYIKNSFIDEIPAKDKIFYIKKYSELEQTLKEKVEDIKKSYETLDDFVNKVKDATTKGINDIENLKQESIKEIDNKVSDFKTFLDEQRDIILNDKKEVNDIKEDIRKDIEDNKLVKTDDTENWQKFSLTEKNGKRIVKEEVNILELETGFYDVLKIKDYTIKNEENDSFLLNVFKSNDDIYNILAFNKTNSNVYSFMTNVNGSSLGWTKLSSQDDIIEKETKKLDDKIKELDDKQQENMREINEIFKRNNQLIFDGNISEKGETYEIDKSFKDFSFLIIFYRFAGGGKTAICYIDTDNKIAIQDFNMTDSNGSNPKNYELGLIFKSNTQFVITHNHEYEIVNNNNIKDSNNIIIRKIWGVY